MARRAAQAALLFILSALARPIAAQVPDFSGTWVLNREKTQLEDMPAIVLELVQSAEAISYQMTVTRPNGESVTRKTLPIDGEGSWTDARGKTFPCSARFSDGRLIVSWQHEQRRSGRWVLLDLEEEHTLSADGMTLSVIHKERWGDRPWGRWPNPMVFDRRPASPGQAPTEAASARPDLFSHAQLNADARQLLDYLESIHPDPYRFSGGKVAFHRRFQDVLQAIPPGGMSREDFARLLRPFVAALADAHTVLPLPRVDSAAPGGVPLSFSSVEKLLYVDGVRSDKDRDLLGARLLSVEGVPVERMVERLYYVWPVENDFNALGVLNVYLGARAYLRELLPEWQDSSTLHVRLRLADGTERNRAFHLPEDGAAPLLTIPSRLELPSTEHRQFAYGFLSADRKTAVLKIDGMTEYRERFEADGQQQELHREAAEAYERAHGEPAPPDPAAVLAGIPSAVETFRQLVTEMKEAGTETLIVDLTRNGGGNSLMADILVYLLNGMKQLTDIVTAETNVRKYSPYVFAQSPGLSLEDLNRRYAPLQSYPFTENDYDFSYERYVSLFLSGAIDLETASSLKYSGSPTFMAEIRDGGYAGYYTPKTVLVATSHETFSSGFTLLRYLNKCGARIVGSTSGQSGNGFGNSIFVSLPNTGLRLFVSQNAYVVFPEEPTQRKMLNPDYELTYERLRAYGFDPNAAVLYAIELLDRP